jgi:acetylornithine deacetylase/succinyl-diaminopimelate desuccinylase-like protein
MEKFLGRRAPVIPTFIPGITDSRYFRERGIAAYGFSPFVLESNEVRGIHGPDERIPLDAFEKGVETTTELVATCSVQD